VDGEKKYRKKVRAMDQLMIGTLLVLIVLGAAWMLMVYNRMMNLISLAAEQRRSIENYRRFRQQYQNLQEEEKSESDSMDRKMNELDRRIEEIKLKQRETISDYHRYCRSIWVKPALFIMGMKNAENRLQEQESFLIERK